MSVHSWRVERVGDYVQIDFRDEANQRIAAVHLHAEDAEVMAEEILEEANR